MLGLLLHSARCQPFYFMNIKVKFHTGLNLSSHVFIFILEFEFLNFLKVTFSDMIIRIKIEKIRFDLSNITLLTHFLTALTFTLKQSNDTMG